MNLEVSRLHAFGGLLEALLSILSSGGYGFRRISIGDMEARSMA